MEGSRGSGSTVHTINEDERTEFTRHINACLLGDSDIGDRLPFPTDTFQVCEDTSHFFELLANRNFMGRCSTSVKVCFLKYASC